MKDSSISKNFDCEAFSFCLCIQLSLTVPSNGKLTTLEAAIPLLKSSDDLKAPPHIELKFYFLKFFPSGPYAASI